MGEGGGGEENLDFNYAYKIRERLNEMSFEKNLGKTKRQVYEILLS